MALSDRYPRFMKLCLQSCSSFGWSHELWILQINPDYQVGVSSRESTNRWTCFASPGSALLDIVGVCCAVTEAIKGTRSRQPTSIREGVIFCAPTSGSPTFHKGLSWFCPTMGPKSGQLILEHACFEDPKKTMVAKTEIPWPLPRDRVGEIRCPNGTIFWGSFWGCPIFGWILAPCVGDLGSAV